MGEIIRLEERTFAAWMQAAELPVLVDFYADSCPVCQRFAPLLDQLAAEEEGRLLIAKVNVDDSQSLVSRYAVMTAPTLVVFAREQVIARLDGVEQPDSVRAFIRTAVHKAGE